MSVYIAEIGFFNYSVLSVIMINSHDFLCALVRKCATNTLYMIDH